LRKKARDANWVQLALRYSEPRAVIHEWRVLPPDLERIRERFPLVASGLAADEEGIDVIPVSPHVDAYVDDRALAEIRREFHPLESSEAPNLRLRVPSMDWIFNRGKAPSPVIAADLLDDPDPRIQRAARRLLRELCG
jgi:hypothetical protein